jgi:hypothetical protein
MGRRGWAGVDLSRECGEILEQFVAEIDIELRFLR